MDLSLEAAARDAPDRPALVLADRSLTYAELANRAARVAGALAARGLRRGDRVALTGAATADSVIAIHAVWHMGATVVPVHPRLTAVERARLIAEAGAIEMPHVAAAAPVPAAAADPLAIVFTSGTTGRPKGAVLSAAAFAAAARASAVVLGWRDGDAWQLALAPAHVGGLAILVRCLAARRAVAIDAPATILSVVPTQLHRMLARSLPPGVRAILVGGAPVEPALLARAEGWPVHTTYGLTEACATVALDGRPLPGVGVRISPTGTIQVAGPTLMSGYLHDPAPFTQDGWLDTGDLGALDADGRLQVFARRTDLILSGGENVYPAEVEDALAELPGVAAACVFGVPDPEWGQVVCAALVCTTAPPDLAPLRARLAGFKCPRRVAVVPALAIGPSGKLDRAATAAAAAPLLRRV